jgi:hypothetical protein
MMNIKWRIKVLIAILKVIIMLRMEEIIMVVDLMVMDSSPIIHHNIIKEMSIHLMF